MLASVHAFWKAEIASSMAFFWAELPSALRSPEKQFALPVAPAEVQPAAGVVVVPLFSDAQAESATAPDRAMAPRALIRETDTSGSLSMGVVWMPGGQAVRPRTLRPPVTLSRSSDRFSPSG